MALAVSSLYAAPAKPHKRRHPATTASTTSAHKRQTLVAAKGSAHRKGTAARVPPRSYQQAPTADRYKEIQQALASKGYFRGEPNGQWGSESTEALKRFQADQSLMPDGKIGSLSLIALGLGPKRLTAKSEATPVPQSTPPAPPAPSAPPR
jgi:peptidoglycan hydrolase-like protein with peptidoglycan-binding domain